MTQRISLTAIALVLALPACDRQEKVAPARAATPHAAGGASAAGGARFAISGLSQQATVGAAGAVTLEVTPTGPLKINPEFPWKLTLESPPAELGLASPVIEKGAMSFTTSKATVPIAVNPSAAGGYTLEGTIDLSVCEATGSKRCFLERAKPVSITVEAIAPPSE